MTFRTNGTPDTTRAQLVGFAAIAVSIYDWTASQPSDPGRVSFQPPTFTIDPVNTATNGGVRLDAQQTASRAFLAIVFVVLLFITIVFYGMWVATGVAAEKSSRVMELMISAASPRQMLTGKVVGIGGAGLTQYLAIAIPALVVLAFQDRIAAAVLGAGWSDGAPLVGLTPALLAGYGVFYLLGFTLFALIYASMGSFVSRPDDLQTLSLPLSLVAMLGYLMAIVALGGGGGAWIRIASFLPPFSPFVMLARLMVAAVEPWEIVLSIGVAAGGHRRHGGRGDPDVRGGGAAVRDSGRDCERSWRRRAGRGRGATAPEAERTGRTAQRSTGEPYGRNHEAHDGRRRESRPYRAPRGRYVDFGRRSARYAALARPRPAITVPG